MVQPLGKILRRPLQKLGLVCTDDPAAPLPGVYPREMETRLHKSLYMNASSRLTHNSQKGHNPNIHQLMNKSNVVDLLNGMLFNQKKELSTDSATTWMKLENMLGERSQTKAAYYIIEMSRIGKSIKTQSWLLVARWGGGGRRGFPLRVMKHSGISGGDCTILWLY